MVSPCLYEFLIKQPKLFYSAASKAACGIAAKNEVNTFLPPEAACHTYGTIKWL